MRIVYIVGLFGLLTCADQAGEWNISQSLAYSHDCGLECQHRLNKTISEDAAIVGLHFDYSFYATSANFSSCLPPGSVLKVQPINPKELTVGGGATFFRIQYTSLDFDGSVVPVTGFVAFPSTPHSSFSPNSSSTSRNYRLAAFAHGTVGISPRCAPSNGLSFYDYSSWQPLLQRGYAIVATDYAGLGNNHTSHKYLSFPAQANDVYYSVVAARKAFSASFTKEWVSFGHSQGGGAVWKLAESEYVRNESERYLGSVAIAPATYFIRDTLKDFDQQEQQQNSTSEATGAGLLPYVNTAAQRVIPTYKESILSRVLSNRTQLVLEAQLCLNTILGISMDLKPSESVNFDAATKHMPALLQWEKMVAPAQGGKSPAPIFIVQGQNDVVVPWETTVQAWNNSCHDDNELHLRLFPLQGHQPVLTAGAAEWMGWIDYIFDRQGQDGKRRYTVRKCTKITREPFDVRYVKAPTETELRPFLS